MVKVFKYIEELDAFVVDPEYRIIARQLGLMEWSEVVWIGRYFLMDNDLGEHWFDNWELRERVAEKIDSLGLDEQEVFLIDPDRFQDGRDGPCHTDEDRKYFWKDVLISLHLSMETLIREARTQNEARRLNDLEEYIPDLEERITHLLTGST
jgi:hypothetical protein